MRGRIVNLAVLTAFACLVVGFGVAVWHANEQQPKYSSNQSAKPKPLEVTHPEGPDERIARYNLWLAILTGVLALSTIALWIETRLASGRQSRDMKESIAAAVRAADVAERSLVEIERALIIPIKIGVNTLARGKDQIIGYRIVLQFKNCGRTVAKRFTGTFNALMWDGELPKDFQYPDRTVAGPASTVGPEVILPFQIDIAIQDVLAIAEKRKNGFIYGWVEYDDIFRTTVKRRTEMCAKIEITGSPLVIQQGPDASPIGLVAYGERYNGIDNDCLYQPGDRPPIGGLPVPTQPPPERNYSTV
jgi:hypothetical protein